MKKSDATIFWENYIDPIIPEIISGKKWYDFSLGSLRTLEELGLAKKIKSGWCINHLNYTFLVDKVGNMISLTCVNPANPGKEDTFLEPSANIERLRFIVSLPKISFHP